MAGVFQTLKVLSLYDGMACGRLAFESAGLEIKQYDAFEIDKYAIKVASHNYPDIIHHGDVFDGDFNKFAGYDYLMGGSPCTYWSVAQAADKREREAKGLGWDLFSQYLRALNEAKPKYFIYENNASMSPAIKKEISRRFGFGPVLINSALVSAQNRERLYWVGKLDVGRYVPVSVEQPADRGIMLKDILDAQPISDTEGKASEIVTIPVCVNPKIEGKQPSLSDRMYSDMGKMPAITASFNPLAVHRVGDRGNGGQSTRLYGVNGKSVTINANGGGGGAQTGLYCVPSCEGQHVYNVENGALIYKGRSCPVRLPDGLYQIRKLTLTECKRLQTVPEWYDMGIISKSQAYKCLGNGWTVEVIAHLIRATQSNKRMGQQSLDSF